MTRPLDRTVDTMPHSSRQHQLLLMQHDRGNALFHMCINCLSMVYLSRQFSAEQQHERNTILELMLVEVAALLLQACSTLEGSAAAAFYIRHRTSCILLLQSIEFAANLAYIPRAFALNWQFNWAMASSTVCSGTPSCRAAPHLTWRCIACQCGYRYT